MEILFFLVPASILLALIALAAFLFAASDGQMEDLDTPAKRMLLDDEEDKGSPDL